MSEIEPLTLGLLLASLAGLTLLGLLAWRWHRLWHPPRVIGPGQLRLKRIAPRRVGEFWQLTYHFAWEPRAGAGRRYD